MAVTAARTNIGRARVYQEPTTFGADVSASIASYGDLRLVGASLPSAAISPEMLPDQRMVQNIHTHYSDVVGFKKGDGLQLKGYLCGSGQTLNAAASPTQTTLCKLLERIVGAYQGTAGSAYASAASSTGVTVTGGQGSRFLAGTLTAIESANASGLFCVRKIATRSTDALTWSIATGLGSTAFTVASGCRLLGALMVYPINSPSGTLGLTFCVEGEDRNQIYWLTGAQASALGFEWPIGKDLMWSTTQMAAKLFLDTEVGTPLNGGALSAATYDDGARVTATAGSIWFTPSGGTTLLAPHISEFTFNSGIKWVSGDTFNGVEGRGYYEYLPDQATATITLPYDVTYVTAHRAGTLYQLLAQAGQTAGGIVALELPTVQIRDVKIIDKGGLLRMQLTLACQTDAVTNTTTALATPPWRIGFM